MIFSTKKSKPEKIPIQLGSDYIERVTSCKFLGVIVDENLTWKNHINLIANKLSKIIGILCKARKFLNKSALLNLYYALFYPHILYCNNIWGNASKQDLWRIFKLQKMSIRIINSIVNVKVPNLISKT